MLIQSGVSIRALSSATEIPCDDSGLLEGAVEVETLSKDYVVISAPLKDGVFRL
jgi:hypothetical protein